MQYSLSHLLSEHLLSGLGFFCFFWSLSRSLVKIRLVLHSAQQRLSGHQTHEAWIDPILPPFFPLSGHENVVYKYFQEKNWKQLWLFRMAFVLWFLFCVQLSQRLARGLLPIWKLWSYKPWCCLLWGCLLPWGCLLLASRNHSNIITCRQLWSGYTELAESKISKLAPACFYCQCDRQSAWDKVQGNFLSRPTTKLFTQYTHYIKYYFSHILQRLIKRKLNDKSVNCF